MKRRDVVSSVRVHDGLHGDDQVVNMISNDVHAFVVFRQGCSQH